MRCRFKLRGAGSNCLRDEFIYQKSFDFFSWFLSNFKLSAFPWKSEVLNAARTVNSIFSKWGISADTSLWNISGEVCSGRAIDSTSTPESYNPFIRCDCSYDSGTTCHITALYLSQFYIFNFSDKIWIWKLTYCFSKQYNFHLFLGFYAFNGTGGSMHWTWLVKFQKSYGLSPISPICMLSTSLTTLE